MNIPQWNGNFLKEFTDQHMADQRRKKKIKSVLSKILIVLMIGGFIWLVK
tara:strand:- start:550 stop:699 length:150 start_codon:yes stop_codon:yes gene_type:complete